MADRKKRGDLGKEKKSSKKSKSKKKSGRRVKDMVVSRTASGHLMAKHRHNAGADGRIPEDEDHVVEGSMDDHIAEHMPMEQEAAPPAPAPQPGAMLGGM